MTREYTSNRADTWHRRAACEQGPVDGESATLAQRRMLLQPSPQLQNRGLLRGAGARWMRIARRVIGPVNPIQPGACRAAHPLTHHRPGLLKPSGDGTYTHPSAHRRHHRPADLLTAFFAMLQKLNDPPSRCEACRLQLASLASADRPCTRSLTLSTSPDWQQVAVISGGSGLLSLARSRVPLHGGGPERTTCRHRRAPFVIIRGDSWIKPRSVEGVCSGSAEGADP